MTRILALFLLGGVACAQSGPSSFTAPSPSPSLPVMSRPNATPPQNASRGSRPLPDLLPQPQGQPTLVGGTISGLDRVRDQITVQTFGGGSMHISFDSRTQVTRDGAAAGSRDLLRNGDRVYLDTMIAGDKVFARSIRVVSEVSTGQIMGQVVSYEPQTGELVLDSAMLANTVKFLVAPNATISRAGRAVSSAELVPGALVSAAFQPAGRGVTFVKQVSIEAMPGNKFVFAGRVVSLDIHLGLLVVVDPRDQKSYSVDFDPNVIQVSENLREGAMVEATASFNGRSYVASSITVSSPNP